MNTSSTTILLKKGTDIAGKSYYKFIETNQTSQPLIRLFLDILQGDSRFTACASDNDLKDGFEIRIIVYTPNKFINNQPRSIIQSFGQEHLSRRSKPSITKVPIIHVVLTDIFSYYFYNPKKDESPKKDKKKLHLSIPRYFQIIDSSIWNHYVPMVKFKSDKEDEADDIFYTLFAKAVDEIYDNYAKGVYKLEVTGEYADINARIVQQSYLTGHHGMGVAPFIFHSEGYIKRLIDDKFKEKHVIDWICERKWRFLLVDDKANSSMSPFHDLNDGRLDTKFKIIKDRLESLFTDCAQFHIFDYKNLPKDERQCGILIESVSNIEEAKKTLIEEQRRYDSILLDYLLEKGKNGGYEYGYDLLNEIKKSDESEREIRDRFYFMFISAYPTAVQERLLAEGLDPHEDYWNINVGACPTNTPQLFSYNLLKFMERRLKRLGISKLSPTKIVNQIHEIFSPTEGKTVREMADERYRDVLSLQYHYSKMVKDVEIPEKEENLFHIKGSVLVTDFIQQKGWLKGFLEHLSHLIYLVAFGTTRQWAEMWEEYLYIRPQLNKWQSNCETKTMIVTKCIEQYISQLKRQQR